MQAEHRQRVASAKRQYIACGWPIWIRTVIGTKRVSVAGALPMCCRNKKSATQRAKSSTSMTFLTIVPAHDASKILLKFGTWVVILILVAVPDANISECSFD
jgi:hypothetical protein